MIIEKTPKPNPKPGVSPRPCPQELGALALLRTLHPSAPEITRMRSVSFAQAGDDGNWSHDPSSGGQRPGAAPPRRAGLRQWAGALRGAGSPRGPAPAPTSAPGGSGCVSSGAGARALSQGGGAGTASSLPPCPRTRPAGLLPTARLPARSPAAARTHTPRPCSLARSSSVALEALGLALERRQRLVLMQPVGCHLRAGTRWEGSGDAS